MKNQLIKNMRGSIIAIVALAFVFVVTQSVIAATGPGGSVSMGGLFKNGAGTVEKFQLSPANTNKVQSLTGVDQFRVYGQSILSDTIINENARFIGDNTSTAPTVPNKTFNVGYADSASVPDHAALQVDGSIKVSALSGSFSPGAMYCLCANGFGELNRCGVYNPAIGETCGS